MTLHKKSKAFFNELPVPSKGQRIDWHGIVGAGEGLSLTESAWLNHSDLIVLARDNRDALQTFGEISFFAQQHNIDVCYLPDVETLPYDLESPHVALTSERAAVLYSLATGEQKKDRLSVFVTPVVNALRRLVGETHWTKGSVAIKEGDKISPLSLRERLLQIGYNETFKVSEIGEFSIHNAVIDIAPTGVSLPCRIRLDNGRVAGIYQLNLSSQASLQPIDRLLILPAREVPTDESILKKFSHRYWSRFEHTKGDPFYEGAKVGVASIGIESYLPLLTDNVVTLFDYLSPSVRVAISGECLSYVDEYLELVASRHRDLTASGSRNLLEPDELWMSKDEFYSAILHQGLVTLSSDPDGEHVFGGMDPEFKRKGNLNETIDALQPWFSRADRILLCMRSEARREQMELICLMAGITPAGVDGWESFVVGNQNVAIVVSQIDDGCWWPDMGLLIITEKEIFGQPIFQKQPQSADDDTDYLFIQDLDGLQIDSPIVHLLYGVGRFKGLRTDVQAGRSKDYVLIEYAESATVYVDTDDLNLLARYSGIDNDKAPLDLVGSEAWLKGLKSAYASARSTATLLLRMYAQRKTINGAVMSEPEYQYERFVNEFPFQETQDQRNAVVDIINDLVSSRPMDRVVTGDVGFGKTEVAMRAAFLVANSGFQVAIVVPTTLLAYQHFETFKQRFQIFNMRIELLSRGNTSEQKSIVRGINDGTIDIVIGTHKLIQKSISFHNLGLLVIDEEHRFGVEQKERIRAACIGVNTLSMTATPIPRTLSMALHGLRDCSIIATPPSKRLSIRTFVREWSQDLIEEAVGRETLRSGQVFYVDNRVETINDTADKLRKLFPGLRIAVAHGQMGEVVLEGVMAAFYRYEYDILVCTTIIETGIDVPNANTIIIERADHFGLAQMHQLRGRVGRSHHQAYAYLCTDSKKALTEVAGQRLQAMLGASSLGQGFLLANYDLEIRGAGELLGKEQSGNIQAIGYALYTRLLERAIEALRDGSSDIDDIFADTKKTSVLLNKDTFIPPEYVADPATRLVLYRRIGSISSALERAKLEKELVDRFGALPAKVRNCLSVAQLKKAMSDHGVKEVTLKDGICSLIYYPDASEHVRKIAAGDGIKMNDSPTNGFLTRTFPLNEETVSRQVKEVLKRICQ